MRASLRRGRDREAPDPLPEAERWFARHGLTYFVPAERARVRAALRWKRLVPVLGGGVLVSGAVGAALAWWTGVLSSVPAVVTAAVLVTLVVYALTALRARPIVGWALGRTVDSLRLLVPMSARALPLLLLFVTFLFINAEVWQLAANLRASQLWLVVLLMAGTATAFLLVRLPEEVDRTDDAVDAAFLRRACAGTPLAESCERLLLAAEQGEGPDPTARATITGYERWNLILVLLVVQSVQVLLLVVVVLGFFLLFGSLTMGEAVQQAWTGLERTHALPYVPSLSTELVSVSVFLAAFSGLYVTVSAVTDETYRTQLLARLVQALERAVGTRAVYLALVEERRSQQAP